MSDNDAVIDLATEVYRLRRAVGEQTEAVKRKKNRITTLERRIKVARQERDDARAKLREVTQAAQSFTPNVLEILGRQAEVARQAGEPVLLSSDEVEWLVVNIRRLVAAGHRAA